MKFNKLLGDLIRIKSFSGKEAKIQNYIFSWLKKSGLKPFFVKENVVVKIKGKDFNQALLFNAHVDTVSIGNIGQWKTDPFKGVVKKGKMYGLGVSDEKASVASLMMLGKELIKIKPVCDIWLMFVVKEEIDGLGTKDFLSWFDTKGYIKAYKDISVILTEPTGLNEIELGHKGNVFAKLTTTGKSGHGSKPIKDKDHAVWKMYKVLKQVKKIEKDWQKKFKDKILGEPTISIPIAIQAGDLTIVNKISDKCEAVVDVRTTPKLDGQVIRLLKNELYDLVQVELVFCPGSYALTDKNSKLVKIAQGVLPKGKLSVADWSNDMCFFTQYDISTIVIGPGEKECIHQPNEYVKLSKLKKAVKIYKEIIKKYGKDY